ncbi:DMT family transporter [Altererythrobacter aquiaggeris]|uniref:DMT family transporter n=1 Tax=Aestuarierythrobacter aquiaggeris TaxID=1898396 RepID=UPI0030185335
MPSARFSSVNRDHHLMPYLATFIGVGLFSLMDALMKSASIAVGAYSALMLRSLIGIAIIGPIWWFGGGKWPAGPVLRIHIRRGFVGAAMAFTFFFALVRLPLAEAIAISFIAPLLALYLAAILLGEKIERKAIIAAILGLIGVAIIAGSRIDQTEMSRDALLGLGAITLSALLYAYNLVLQREQALVARPREVAAFQNAIVSLILLVAAPFALVWPDNSRVWIDISGGAVLAVAAVIVLSWAYSRAQAQALVPIEYSGLLWAAWFGWLFFAEPVTVPTIAGAGLIVIGCWIATRKRTIQTAL